MVPWEDSLNGYMGTCSLMCYAANKLTYYDVVMVNISERTVKSFSSYHHAMIRRKKKRKKAFLRNALMSILP